MGCVSLQPYREDDLHVPSNLGWTSFLKASSPPRRPVHPGRVASANHGRFLRLTEAGEVDASVSGVLRKVRRPVARRGDWVILRSDDAVIDASYTATLRLPEAAGTGNPRAGAGGQYRRTVHRQRPGRDYNPRRSNVFGQWPTRVARVRSSAPTRPISRRSSGFWISEIVASVQQFDPTLLCSPSALRQTRTLDAPGQLAPGQTAALIGLSGVGKSHHSQPAALGRAPANECCARI